jgi:hypothetical protein
VSRCTLLEWRKALELPLDKHDNMFDPSSTPERTPTDIKAQALGYEDAKDAVLDLRLVQGLTLAEAAKVLDVHPSTILSYTPTTVRGRIYNRSEAWWVQRRQWARDMMERFRNSHRRRHPFSRDNDILFRGAE